MNITELTVLLLKSILIVAISCYSLNASAGDLDNIRKLSSAGKYSDALSTIDKHIERNPGRPEILFLKAKILETTGETAGAVKLYKELTISHPRLAEPFNNLAALYLKAGDHESAIKTLEAAFQGHESYATVFENLRSIYDRLASDAYRKALNLKVPAQSLALVSLDQISTQSSTITRNYLPQNVTDANSAQTPGVADTDNEDQIIVIAVTDPGISSIVDESFPGQSANAADTLVDDVKPDPDLLPEANVAADETSSPGQNSDSPEYDQPPVYAPKDAISSTEDIKLVSAGVPKTSVVQKTGESIPEKVAVASLNIQGEISPDLKSGVTSQDSTIAQITELPDLPGSGLETTKKSNLSDSGNSATLNHPSNNEAIMNRVESWADAWSNRDLDRYLSYYSGEFVPRYNLTLEQWKKHQQALWRWRKLITVKLSDVIIDVFGNDAVVKFTQYYKSNTFENTIGKTLKLRQENGYWYITEEFI